MSFVQLKKTFLVGTGVTKNDIITGAYLEEAHKFQGAVRDGLRVYKSYKFLSILFTLFAMAVLGFFITSVFLMEKNYLVNELKDDIHIARQESRELQINFSQQSSLQRILELSASSLYSEMEYINYIERSSSSPFALED